MDLDRTYPASEFFQSQPVQVILLNNLFIWSKLHEDLSYRQGFNELLAPIIQVVFNGADMNDGDDASALLFDRAFLEHDCFAIFEAVMVRVKKFYEIIDTRKQAKMRKLGIKDLEKRSIVVELCDEIQKNLLKQIDPRLCTHLSTQGVEPQVYALYEALDVLLMLIGGGSVCCLPESLTWTRPFKYGMLSLKSQKRMIFLLYPFFLSLC